ncbi:MAG TPA: thiopurine S-methyltransferase [Noviherbaspirillum sp.]|nr:thiopurine S-methyltransferase [Noviherbaspirillum sp.]
MDHSFWHAKWEKNEIAFHEREANPLLVRNFNALSLEKGSRVFLPLCGKTLDIPWLLSKGFRVAGAELSEIAVRQLFEEMGVKPTVSRLGPLVHYAADGVDLYAGDIFDLTGGVLGRVDAVYDRAALVAMPAEMRAKYAAHLAAMTDKAPQLLICYEYDQALQPGPPFSVTSEEVRRLYSSLFELSDLVSVVVPGGLRGKCPATERVWLLRKP